ncbi:MAG: hypothetical protein ACFB11_12905 [Paracoccaceae bacterium]
MSSIRFGTFPDFVDSLRVLAPLVMAYAAAFAGPDRIALAGQGCFGRLLGLRGRFEDESAA